MVEFAGGVGKGIDKQLLNIIVEVSPQIKEMGLIHTVPKPLGVGTIEKGFTTYFIAEKDVEVTFISKALNADNIEIGRVIVEVKMKKDEANYINFPFSNQIDSNLVKKYLLELKK